MKLFVLVKLLKEIKKIDLYEKNIFGHRIHRTTSK